MEREHLMASPIQPNPSPKAKFTGIKACVDAHCELLQRPDVESSLNTAFAQYQWELCGGDMPVHVDGNTSASHFYKLMGAHELLRVFKNLAKTHVPLPPTPSSGDLPPI